MLSYSTKDEIYQIETRFVNRQEMFFWEVFHVSLPLPAEEQKQFIALRLGCLYLLIYL